jgi:hypothetical protein
MTRARHALLTLATGASLLSLVFAGACSGATPRDINDRDAESGFEPPAAANDAGDASDSAGAASTAGSGGAAGSDGTAGAGGSAGATAGASGSGGAAGAVSDGGTGQ